MHTLVEKQVMGAYGFHDDMQWHEWVKFLWFYSIPSSPNSYVSAHPLLSSKQRNTLLLTTFVVISGRKISTFVILQNGVLLLMMLLLPKRSRKNIGKHKTKALCANFNLYMELESVCLTIFLFICTCSFSAIGIQCGRSAILRMTVTSTR